MKNTPENQLFQTGQSMGKIAPGFEEEWSNICVRISDLAKRGKYEEAEKLRSHLFDRRDGFLRHEKRQAVIEKEVEGQRAAEMRTVFAADLQESLKEQLRAIDEQEQGQIQEAQSKYSAAADELSKWTSLHSSRGFRPSPQLRRIKQNEMQCARLGRFIEASKMKRDHDKLFESERLLHERQVGQEAEKKRRVLNARLDSDLRAIRERCEHQRRVAKYGCDVSLVKLEKRVRALLLRKRLDSSNLEQWGERPERSDLATKLSA